MDGVGKSDKNQQFLTLFNAQGARSILEYLSLPLCRLQSLLYTECRFCKTLKKEPRIPISFSNRLCRPAEIGHFPSFNFSLTTYCPQICSSMTILLFFLLSLSLLSPCCIMSPQKPPPPPTPQPFSFRSTSSLDLFSISPGPKFF